MPVRYILSSMWVRLSIFSQLSIIQYMGLCVFGLPISLVMIERIYTLSYYYHQIGSMNYYPLFRVRSWNNGIRCMSLYILMDINLTGINQPNSQIPEYTCSISHNAPFRTAMCTFLFRNGTLWDMEQVHSGVVKRFYIFVLFQGASGRQTSWLYLSGNQGFTLISALIRAVLGMRPANERQRYSVTSLIGGAQAYNQPC